MSANQRFQDRLLTCADCGKDFLFSASEQASDCERGLRPPTRCKNCRETKRDLRVVYAEKKGEKK